MPIVIGRPRKGNQYLEQVINHFSKKVNLSHDLEVRSSS